MKIDKLKVRPRKDAHIGPCAAELATMLACWASSNDLNSVGPCAESARSLKECMQNSRAAGKKGRPTINYHLARLGKRV